MIETAYAATEETLSIHLAPDILGHFLSIPITNTLLTVWFVMAILIISSWFLRRRLKEVPGKFQLIIEELVSYVHSYVTETLGNPKLAKKVFPLILTIFIFIHHIKPSLNI